MKGEGGEEERWHMSALWRKERGDPDAGSFTSMLT